MILRLVFMLVVFPAFISCNRAGRGQVPQITIEVRALIYLDKTNPPIKTPSHFNRPFFVHEDRTVDVIDYENHRICRFNESGRLTGTIGGIGQQIEDLYYPVGIYGKDGRIFVLNREGQELKIFDKSGRFHSSFPLMDNPRGSSSSIVVSAEEIIVPVRRHLHSIDEVNSQPLLEVFDFNGRMIRKIGKSVPCRTAASHMVFNSVFLHLHEGIVYGAFRDLPILFAYDLAGKEQFYRDLRTSGLPEINKSIARAKEFGADSPDHSSHELRTLSVCYFRGVGFYKSRVYVLSQEDGLLVFTKSGDLVERVYVSIDKIKFRMEFFQFDSHGRIYGSGFHPQTNSRFIFGPH